MINKCKGGIDFNEFVSSFFYGYFMCGENVVVGGSGVISECVMNSL